jgi:hypothetical protein
VKFGRARRVPWSCASLASRRMHGDGWCDPPAKTRQEQIQATAVRLPPETDLAEMFGIEFAPKAED